MLACCNLFVAGRGLMTSFLSPMIAITILTFTAGCLGDAAGPAVTTPDSPVHHTFRMLAVEWKGSTTTPKEAYPENTTLPEGNGYGLTPPDDTGRWHVNAYRWDPGMLVVRSGDTVTLDVFGVNGALHEAEIEDHGVTFNVTRGSFSQVTFTAGEPGTYRIVCHTHAPAMEAPLVVLPRSA